MILVEIEIYKITYELLQVPSYEPLAGAWRPRAAGHHILQLLPDAINRMEYRAVRWSGHQAHVRRSGARPGRMRLKEGPLHRGGDPFDASGKASA